MDNINLLFFDIVFP